jgi:hypothetical protein
MGCNSDYMKPTKQEEFHKQTAKLLIHAKKILGVEVTAEDKKNETSSYGDPSVVPALCKLLGDLTKTKRDKVLYSDAKDKVRRQLADWWEEHEAADKARRKKEQESEKYGRLMKSASEKAKQFLSEEEFAAVFKKKS